MTNIDKELVCHHCHVIYTCCGSLQCCDICGRKLRWVDTDKILDLKKGWQKWEQKRGLTPDFAYRV